MNHIELAASKATAVQSGKSKLDKWVQ